MLLFFKQAQQTACVQASFVQFKDGGPLQTYAIQFLEEASTKIAHLSLQVEQADSPKKTKQSNCQSELTIKMERKLYYQLIR